MNRLFNWSQLNAARTSETSEQLRSTVVVPRRSESNAGNESHSRLVARLTQRKHRRPINKLSPFSLSPFRYVTVLVLPFCRRSGCRRFSILAYLRADCLSLSTFRLPSVRNVCTIILSSYNAIFNLVFLVNNKRYNSKIVILSLFEKVNLVHIYNVYNENIYIF